MLSRRSDGRDNAGSRNRGVRLPPRTKVLFRPVSTIGLIAGGGRFPILFADSAHRAGHRVIAVAHRNETDPSLAKYVDSIIWVKMGQLGRLVSALKESGAEGTVMLGAITKARLYRDVWPDTAGIKVIAQVAVRSDDNLLRAIARHLEEQGLPIVDPTPFLQDRLAPEGVLGKYQPDEEELADVRYGIELARGIGRLDLGQTVVVKRRAALAVEAMEGTDACIRRGGGFGHKGVVVVKAMKPGQDRRFDIPAVGPDTVETLREVKARVLAVEAGATLVMDLERMVELADRSKIVLMGIR